MRNPNHKFPLHSDSIISQVWPSNIMTNFSLEKFTYIFVIYFSFYKPVLFINIYIYMYTHIFTRVRCGLFLCAYTYVFSHKYLSICLYNRLSLYDKLMLGLETAWNLEQGKGKTGMHHVAFPMMIYGGTFKKEKRLIQGSSNPLGR